MSHRAVLLRLFYFPHCDESLADCHPRPLASEGEDGISGHPWEDVASGERGGGDLRPTGRLVLEDEENIHRADFSALVVGSVQPEDLIGAVFLGGYLARKDRRGVVATDFRVAHSPRPGPHVDRVGEEFDGFEAGGVVGADRRQDHIELHILRGVHPEDGRGADGGGADIKRVALLVGYPRLV